MPTPLGKKPVLGYGASLAIGAAETPLLEMAQGYAAFADAGRVKPVSGIVKVTDQRGSLFSLEGVTNPEDKGEEVLDPRIAYEITSILSDVSARPSEYWQQILSVPGTQAAAKTGTSNKCLERELREGVDPNVAPCKKRRPDNAWTIGYTPTLVAGVWVGMGSHSPLHSSKPNNMVHPFQKPCA
jgi:membrane peptidoglycan carboxypeptidase